MAKEKEQDCFFITQVDIPIYYYSFELIYIKDMDKYKRVNRGEWDLLNNCNACVVFEDDFMAKMLTKSTTTTHDILHECIHIYTDLLEAKDLPIELKKENDEFHAYTLAYIQHKTLEADLALRSKFIK